MFRSNACILKNNLKVKKVNERFAARVKIDVSLRLELHVSLSIKRGLGSFFLFFFVGMLQLLVLPEKDSTK